MAKQIIRVESIKSPAAFAAKFRHNYRVREVPNADGERSEQNRQLVRLPAGMTYHSFYQYKMAQLPYYRDHAPKKNANLGLEVLMTYGAGELPKDFSLDKWCGKSVEFLRDYFGKDNIASAVLHMDETTPHIHAVIIPVHDGKLNSSHYVGSRAQMRQLHERYYDYMKECGLERETSFAYGTREKIGAFYKNISMETEEELPGPEEGETLAEYAKRANEFYRRQTKGARDREYLNKKDRERIKQLEKANITMQKRHDSLIRQIGSVENAKEAIRYRDGLVEGIKDLQKTDPETAGSLETVISGILAEQEKKLMKREKERA